MKSEFTFALHGASHFRKVVPSFALLDVQSDVIVAYLYRLVDDDVKVERVQFKKLRATD